MPRTARTRSTRSARAVVRSAALLAGSLGLVLAGSAPASSAPSAGSTVYDIAWTFAGGVQTPAGALSSRSYATLDDLLASDQNDRARAKPDNGESVSIEGPCVAGNYGSSAVTLYGQNPNWFDLADATVAQGTRVSVMCKRPDGTQLRYRWGHVKDNGNCVQLTRPAQNRLSLTAPAGCKVERHLVSSSGKATLQFSGDLEFTSGIVLASRQ